ncbi:MAG: BTAD domain-containing putative transcriptional regulator, partial [Acidimicrobiales bacterium]
LEALAETALAVAANRAGQIESNTPDLVAATDHLIDLTDRFQASPQLAWLIAICLLEQRHANTALRWADWIERCAESVGDRALGVVPPAVRATAAVYAGQFDVAVASSQSAVDRALACGHQTLTAQTLGLLTSACAARGLFARGFAAGSRQFALSDDTVRVPRIQTLVSLSALELQRGRVSSAFSWLDAAREEFTDDDGEPAVPEDHSVGLHWGMAFAELVVLSRRGDDLSALVKTMETAPRSGEMSVGLLWMQSQALADPEEASAYFEQADAMLAAVPYSQARLQLTWGVRLSDWNRPDEARHQLEQARATFASVHADGWEQVAARELRNLPETRRSGAPGEHALSHPAPEETEPDSGPSMVPEVGPLGHPRWEITLLGSFNVRHEGRPVALPISLAVQALKIVTLRKRISVDELVEMLWPDAHPGVGNRRLRNVLWRNRVSCGDLLYRDGNFICLAKEAVVDADRFRSAAERAIEGEGTDLIREALALYPDELLPGDHYVDWPTARREALAGLYMSLLDLLLDQAIADGQNHEALGFLEKLIEADPYEERHYVRAAELHAASGNVSRALSTLSRADRTLTDLGIGPSRMVEQVRQKLAS